MPYLTELEVRLLRGTPEEREAEARRQGIFECWETKSRRDQEKGHGQEEAQAPEQGMHHQDARARVAIRAHAMSQLKQRILDRLEGRRANAVRNIALHSDPQAVRDSEVRAKAYACALYDVESLFAEAGKEPPHFTREQMELLLGVKLDKERMDRIAVIFNVPTEYLFPEE